MLFEKYGTIIITISDEPNKTYEQELTDDLIINYTLLFYEIIFS